MSYKANFGIEHFISFESANNILLGFCRLRIPDLKSTRTPSYLKNSAFIRELHVYGELSPLASQKNIQHKGIGKKLMLEAEKIIQANNLKKIIVISGVGVRGYYRKLGYRLYHTYMVKRLN
ncbi:MAG: GNAT family N-acetyltransferase [Candidatus Falkowbacteria bacterium]|nr:GNAT family N-acetyltransferase [Candidatus Falkowbacteria bacterium]